MAMLSWHKTLFVSVLLSVRSPTLLQFLFFSPIAVPSSISTLWLLYSCCRYAVIKTISISLPASHTYKSWFSIVSHTHTWSGEHRVRAWLVDFCVAGRGWRRGRSGRGRQTHAGISLCPLLGLTHFSSSSIQNKGRKERGWLWFQQWSHCIPTPLANINYNLRLS